MKKLLSLTILLSVLLMGCTESSPVGCENQIDLIYSASLDSEVRGSFFLAIGSVDERQRYYFYKETDDGGLKLDDVLASMVTIYQDESKAPYILHNDWRCDPESFYELHVPEGTIIQNFNLNL